MVRHAALRASDADRDAVAERLRAAAVEGRLDADELEQRVHVALRARTYGQLQQLLDDLPDAPRSWRGRPRVAGRPTTTAVVLAVRLLAFLVIATVVIAVTVLAAAWWMLWVVVWFVMCGRHRRFASPRRRHGGGRPASNSIWI
jgi:Flp pilus assembly protein TadB